MRFTRLAFLGVLSACAAAGAACSNSVATQAAGGTTGTGGTTGATTSSSTTGTGAADAGPADAAPDVDFGMPSTTYPAPHMAPPQVVNSVSNPGPVLVSPRIVPIFFSNEDPTYLAELEDFVSKVGATKYWAAATAEYGVGPATATAPIVLDEAAPATIDDNMAPAGSPAGTWTIQSWLADKLSGQTSDAGADGGVEPAFPVNDANTVYVLHYPAGTTVTAGGQASCTAFGGYHDNFTIPNSGFPVAYAVVPRCASFGAISGIDAVTGPESHELVEAVTDPYPSSNTPAYSGIDDNHIYWSRILGGGEVGDMCAQFSNVFTKFPELDYTVQRTWSDKAALAGHDPCVPPLAGEVYFNTAPLLTDVISTTYLGMPVKTLGVTIPVGMTKTIELDLFSDAATSGPWTIDAKDAQAAFGGTALLDVSLDRTTGVNGDKIHLTITVKTAGKHGTESFLVHSTLGSEDNLWFGLVGQ
jgi:hypothetical protein